MASRADQLRATALMWLLGSTEQGRAALASVEQGRRYRLAQRLYSVYEKRAIDWYFADDYDRSSAAERAIRSWWPDEGPEPTGILVLEGGKGTGKTSAAVGLLLRRGGEFIRAGSLHDIPLGDKGEETMERLRNAPLLVLDNLGSERDIGPTLARVHGVIVHRDGQRLPTVVTTTLIGDFRDKRGNPIPDIPPDRTFAGRYDDDFVDRILGNGVWITIEEPSRRGQGQPDLARIQRAARLAEIYEDLEGVKRGAGDVRAIEVLARVSGISHAEIDAKAEETLTQMERMLAELPTSLRGHPVFEGYRAKWGPGNGDSEGVALADP